MVGKLVTWLMLKLFQSKLFQKREVAIWVSWPNRVPGLIDSSYLARAIRHGR